MKMPPIEKLLSRLDRVKELAPDRWISSCPTEAHQHGDRSRGLSVRETNDGTLLIKCHAGCSADSIVRAVGLELRDLFPHRAATNVRRHNFVPRKKRIDLYRRDIEILVCNIFFNDLITGKITAADVVRCRLALSRVITWGRSRDES